MSESYVFQPTEIVLAKVKGYSAWPSMIIPEEIIPANVMKSEHMNSDGDDGDSESDIDTTDTDKYIVYSDILSFKKFTKPNDSYCVKFFCDDSYIWVKHHDLSILTIEECQDWLNSTIRKNKKLIPAYEMALNGLVTKNGIDVWEFVEYGSMGKAKNDEEYVEDGDDNDETNGSRRSKRTKRATRSSSRQRTKRQQENEEVENISASKRTRSRRSVKSESTSKNEVARPAPKKAKASTAKTKSAITSKVTPNLKSKKKSEPKPVLFNYDDDEDWSVVGLGPQDLSVNKRVSPLVKKLSQKKNIDKHNDLKLDIQDRIGSVNSLLSNIFTSSFEEEHNTKKNDLEIILDELDIAIGMRGPHNEFISAFISNSELLFNFRLLFNLKGQDLKNWSLWNGFQRIFRQIYEHEFLSDSKAWSLHPENKEMNEIPDVDSNLKVE
ncbi:similar to Saccharomyces cerevisiae YMR044W IOC4 Member of a complex (Isw1b) with Isw1p and Ioc2p [Maudiozyma saulgeensis]|uniref:Similar to Saccharomyces cerevisiae YMR044W IOC4 Member of a complex (Isw1b) with Isw1p and Ioc2p n=1 Tax=Maudiozyma saulgeensis TaxID=1789683 RepID=A0A1X7R8H7_9SACH|nr:similar to Saccharomyces cerevisiae YMR044W IOC4 Member of a complex (Isw1b) with Isw1p and Ioc2p [Kazachstania saulgeensis]